MLRVDQVANALAIDSRPWLALRRWGRNFRACRCALMGYMAPDFTTIRRFVAWFSIAVLGVASWLPAEEMIRTSADARLEHAAAYLISGLAVFTAYPRRLKWLIAILMTYYAGILEFGQLFSPVATRRFWIGHLALAACCARCCCMTPINEFMHRKACKNMLKLRSIGIRDYSVLESKQLTAPGPTGDEIRIEGRPWRPFEPIARA